MKYRLVPKYQPALLSIYQDVFKESKYTFRNNKDNFLRTILSHFKNRKFVSRPIIACHVLPAMSLCALSSCVFLCQQRTLLLTLKIKGGWG